LDITGSAHASVEGAASASAELSPLRYQTGCAGAVNADAMLLDQCRFETHDRRWQHGVPARCERSKRGLSNLQIAMFASDCAAPLNNCRTLFSSKT
jgi:hypothetical protein